MLGLATQALPGEGLCIQLWGLGWKTTLRGGHWEQVIGAPNDPHVNQ